MAGLVFRYKPNDTALERMHPTMKLILLIVLSIAFSNFVSFELYISTCLLFIIGYAFKIHVFKELGKMPMLLSIALIIGISEYISSRNIHTSFDKSISFISIIALAVIFTSSTDIIELSACLGQTLYPLLKKKAWKLASYIMITIALFPMIFDTATTMLQARRARNGRFLSHPFKNMSEYTICLMKLLFKRTAIFEDALLARAFQPDASRVARKISYSDILILICVVLMMIIPLLVKKLL